MWFWRRQRPFQPDRQQFHGTLRPRKHRSCCGRNLQDLTQQLLFRVRVCSVRVARKSTSVFSGTRPVSLATVTTTIGPNLCACPSEFASVVEDGKPHCRIEMRGEAPIVNHAFKNDTGKLPRGRAVCCTCDAGHTVQGGVLGAPTVWNLQSRAPVPSGEVHIADLRQR